MNTVSHEGLLESYDSVGHFSEGLAWATKDGVQFHICRDGTRVS